MSNDTLEKTTLLDIDKLQAEMREAHRLLNAHGLGHYWTPNIETFNTTVLSSLKKRT
jgi:hypothetical protein